MCLLDAVVHWDATRIRCISQSHLDSENPMRNRSSLHAVCGVEYAAQAMAVHGTLIGSIDGRPRAGYLVSVRDMVCSKQRLDNLKGDLMVDAEQVLSDGSRGIYQFALRVGEHDVLSGRATVILEDLRV